MKRLPGLLIISLIFLLAGSIAYGQGLGLEEGKIDWEQGVIKVYGFGAMPEKKNKSVAKLLAQRAAKADAYRNAAEYVEGIAVSSSTEVEEYITTSDQISLEVSGLIKKGRFTTIQYNSDGTCRVTLEVPLAGPGGLTSFFEKKVKEETPSYPIADQEKYIEEENKVGQETKVEETYTGVIIDTRGLRIQPALYPQIFDTDGYLLYGPTMLEANHNDRTMVAYSRSMDKAKEMARVGDNPLILNANSRVKSTSKPTDIVLTNQDAGAFLKVDKQSDVLPNRAVIFIID